MKSTIVALLSLGLSWSCVRITTVNVGQKTSLERQLIGNFEPLTDDEILVATVRAKHGMSVAAGDEVQRVLAARRRQLFNEDDISRLQEAGCTEETEDATLSVRDCSPEDAVLLEIQKRVIEEENQDRATIIDWALRRDPSLTPGDRDKVVKIYAAYLRDRRRGTPKPAESRAP